MYSMTIYVCMYDSAQWWEYSPTTQDVAGSIPAHNICVHEHVCLYWVSVFLYICMDLQKKTISMYLSVI
jgi:hypothetical protein